MMAGRVPLARRALFQDRRRTLLATAGVAAAFLLVLLLDGIVAGGMRQVTAYVRTSPADVIVAEQGVRTMHMSVSALPPDTVTAVRSIEGVAWAEELRYASSTVTAGDGRELTYVFGYDPTGRLGPRKITSGRAPGSGEALVDAVAASRLGVGVGETVGVFGDSFTVSGLFDDGTSMINTITFITTEDYARLRGPSIAYVFAGAGKVQPGELATRLGEALPHATVQTREEFVDEEAAIVGDMAADLLEIMSIVGFLIALAVIGLSLFTLTLAKLREHAIVKALGSNNRGVGGIVLRQATWSVALALALATVLGLVIAALIGSVMPALLVIIEPASVVRVGVGGLIAGTVGSIIPLRRVFNVDPATAFRRAS
jgi:putative ABC transport system permease protein